MFRKALMSILVLLALVSSSLYNIPAARAQQSASELREITFYSRALKQQMKMNVYLPPNYNTHSHYPVLYLLHGWGGDQDTWMPNMGLNKVADKLLAAHKLKPMIIVTPAYGNSYGVNSYTSTLNEGGFNFGMYEDYLIHDVIGYVDAHFPTIANRNGRYIGGFSMGGWAALFLAFTHPTMFSKVGADSPALWLKVTDSPEVWVNLLYPTKKLQEKRDPIYLAMHSNQLTNLDVYLDVGSHDGYKFYQGTSQLYNILKQKDVRVQYHLNPGQHLVVYWEAHEKDYLLFYDGTKNATS